jgi:hypothetical protein
LITGGALLMLIAAYFAIRASRQTQLWPASATSRQSDRATFPKYASISKEGTSVYLAHDDAELHYAMFYAGAFNASTSGSQNRHGLTWRDTSAIKLANGRSFGISRDSANDLYLTINGVEHDLRRGRLFVLKDDGTVSQRNAQLSLEEARDPKKLQQRSEREDSAQVPLESAATGEAKPVEQK